MRKCWKRARVSYLSPGLARTPEYSWPTQRCPRKIWNRISTLECSLLWPADSSYRGNVAMFLTAEIVVDSHVIALVVDEARLPIPRVIVRVVYGDDDLELRRADFADAFERAHLVGLRRARGVNKGLFIETGRLDDQRIALETAHGMAVIERKGDQLLFSGHRLVHPDHTDLVVEFVNDRDISGRPLDGFERVRRGQPAGEPIPPAVLAGSIRNPAV